MQNNTFPTSFVGQNLIKLSAVDSTNSFMKGIMSNSEPLPEGTVIMADNQYGGRGQAGNTWYAEPGKNLTFSVLLRPDFITPDQQFRLNMVVSTALMHTLRELCGEGAKTKWPNDIYFNDRKLGGVLIENTLSGSQIKASVIGIGLNVNQLSFDGDLGARATSLQIITGKPIELDLLLRSVCVQIELAYLKLRTGPVDSLYHDYVKDLYLYGENALYRQNGEIIEGMITGIAERGQLELTTSAGLKRFDFKEIEFLHKKN
ncbi:biotin biosynthesis protein BioC [Pedobacter antarcticus 4BY]|uniref:Biotin biosynthesis protein BioC n=1 Tax=Pedobacter antarcticus 4BY TaxID=1358423 RepID=A0A081PDX7_9SPHI|nr:biotin biosynthesis protein BioC [Pedobacter antarcticus 4BY]